jgi:hypothetical protein
VLVAEATVRYGQDADPAGGTALDAATDGRTVTVVCSRTVEIPFGAAVGAPHGLDRTVTARARPVRRR